MARVTQQKPAKQAGPSNSNNKNRSAQVAKQRNTKKQKVVVESNGQGSNKPRNVVSKSRKMMRKQRTSRKYMQPAHKVRQLTFHTDPPPGYTFIPAGNPQLTTALKEFAKKGNFKIYSVSVSTILTY